LQDNQKPDLIAQRHAKLEQIKQLGHAAYPHNYNFSHTIPQILDAYTAGRKSSWRHSASRCASVVACGDARAGQGRIFEHFQRQPSAPIWIYTRLDAVGEANFALYQLLDIGDFIGVAGYLFRTKTNELSVHAQKIDFLAKSFLPLPDKWHGLSDVEIRYRQRYLDLISNQESRQVFVTRSRIIKGIRDFLDARGFIEVETPMMQPLAVATARPSRRITTHWGWIFLRIAPELYLRLIVVNWNAFMRLIATFAMRASRRITIPSSRCSSFTSLTATIAI
jgi:lysyl-tRNA synthetase class 2